MHRIKPFLLKGLRHVYKKVYSKASNGGRNWQMFSNKDYSNDLIYSHLMSDKPCMVARLGSTETLCLVNYLGVKQRNTKWVDFVKGESLTWWWEPATINQMKNWSGFFPAQIDKIEEFSQLMLKDIPEVDILGSWLTEEKYFNDLLINAKRVVLEDLEPFFSVKPWTLALEGKKVLVVHPFADTIEQQYRNRELLFDNHLLPEFKLNTVKAVQSLAGENTDFKDWFEALEWMKSRIDEVDYDVCIIGCGAYGFPLAAHVKRMGKKAVHLGGVTQLLFGIKGKRWEEFIVWPYSNLFNEHWVRPGQSETPKNAASVEDTCYW